MVQWQGRDVAMFGVAPSALRLKCEDACAGKRVRRKASGTKTANEQSF
jgi:hypothetical protein